jgi:hypothetical protein
MWGMRVMGGSGGREASSMAAANSAALMSGFLWGLLLLLLARVMAAGSGKGVGFTDVDEGFGIPANDDECLWVF